MASKGLSVSHLPVVGGLGAPLLAVGLAAHAAEWLALPIRQRKQLKKDLAFTMQVRGLVREELLAHLTEVESRPAPRFWRRNRYDLDAQWTREAIAKIEDRGYTPPEINQ